MGRKSYQIAPRRTMRDSDDCGMPFPDKHHTGLARPGHRPVSQPKVCNGGQFAAGIQQGNMAAHPRHDGMFLKQVFQGPVVQIPAGLHRFPAGAKSDPQPAAQGA